MPVGVELLLTCEHGGNRVPPGYEHLFRGKEALLESHRGWDPGALDLAVHLAEALEVHLLAHTVTRLLVEPNRSIGNPALFSSITRTLDRRTRLALLKEYYLPYRQAVGDEVMRGVRDRHRVVHLSVHTFTPVFDGTVRNVDAGLLYDPSRFEEKDFCLSWQEEWIRRQPNMRVRRNSPYRGASDSVVTALRRRLPPAAYFGLELEVNQRFFLEGGTEWDEVKSSCLASFHDTLLSRFSGAYLEG